MSHSMSNPGSSQLPPIPSQPQSKDDPNSTWYRPPPPPPPVDCLPSSPIVLQSDGKPEALAFDAASVPPAHAGSLTPRLPGEGEPPNSDGWKAPASSHLNGSVAPTAPPTNGSPSLNSLNSLNSCDPAGQAVAAPMPPELEDAAFYGPVGELVRLIEPHTEADPAGLLLQMLAALGSIIGRGAHVLAERTPHFFNLFVALIGDSSRGRKGSSWQQVLTVIRLVDNTFFLREKSGCISGEGIIHHIRDPLKAQVLGKDTKGASVSKEVIKDPGVPDKRLCLVETEFSKVLKAMNRQGNTMSDVFRQAWDGGTLQTLAKTCHNIATHPHVSLVSHCTSADIRKHLTDTDMANGFANRNLWILVNRSKLLPEGGNLDENALVPWVEQLKKAVQFAKTAGALQRDEAARALWRIDYAYLTDGPPGLVGAITNRAEAQVLRLSGLFAVLDGSRLIGVRHHLAAMAIWRYCECSAHTLFRDRTGNSRADKIAGALRNAGTLGLSKSEIQNSVFSRNASAHDIHEALMLLVAMRIAEFHPGGVGNVDRWFIPG
ncbi:MAG: hypothetical protein JWO08_1546 [Verrucomicrobiaceae bacterium]|nr:hypothetical protein [Verrucomicrobiaceae bacterium]